MAKTPNVILHIGAHKTATTHLQLALQSVRAELADMGVGVYGPTQLRGAGLTLAERFSLPHAKTDAMLSEDPQAEWAEMSSGFDRIILSEENFVGVLNRAGGKIKFPLYPNAVEHVAGLASAIAPKGLDVFLSIRAPATFLNSIYSQILMSGGAVRPEAFKTKNTLASVNWVQYIERLSRVKSLRSLVVWPYEDYATHFLRIVALMAGDQPSKVVKWQDDYAHRGLSARAVAEILDLDHGARSTRQAKLLKLRFPASEEFPPFDLFSGEDHAQSGVLYADQIKVLEQMPKVTLLRA